MIVCSRCQVAFNVTTVGITVVEHYKHGPYRLWQADELTCPQCGVSIIARFGEKAVAEHFQAEEFDAILANADPAKLRHCFEHLPDPEVTMRLVDTVKKKKAGPEL